jgi:light-independent protochlorophyllide reductase subunit B
MFRGDAEFHEDAAPSHLGGAARMQSAPQPTPQPAVMLAEPDRSAQPAISPELASTVTTSSVASAWDADAEKELKKIPFFVRGKARRNTERYASERGLSVITTETLYDAKSYFAR